MATALDLLMSAKEDVNLLSEESDICTIDAKTRIIFVPSTIVVGGVQSDKNAERIKFSCPKIVGDNLDLSKFSVRINFENVSSVDFNVSIKDQYICDDVAVDGENVTFSWLIGKNAARYMGTVRFIVCAVKTDSDSNISVEWNTAIAEVPVLEGIEIDQPQIGQEEKDVINQLLELTKNTSAEAVQNVNSAKEQAIKDIQSVSQPDTTLTIEGGLAEAKATGEAIDSLKEDLVKVITPIWNNGYYINRNNRKIANEEYSYSNPIMLKKGETITFSGSITANVSPISAMTAYDYTYTPLIPSVGGTFSYTTEEDLMVVLSANTNSIGECTIRTLANNKYLDEKIKLNYGNVINGKIINKNNGLMQDTNSACSVTDFIQCSNYKQIRIPMMYYSNGGFAFYSANKKFISGNGQVNHQRFGTYVDIYVPENAVHFRTTFLSDYKEDFYVSANTLDDVIIDNVPLFISDNFVDDILVPSLVGANISNDIRNTASAITTTENEFAHASIFKIIGDKGYVVYMSNTETKVEFDENCYIRLAVFDMNNISNITKYTVADKNTNPINGRCAGVSMTEKNNLLNIVFFGLVNNIPTLFKRIFNPETNSFSDLEICKLTYNEKQYDFNATNFHATIGKDYGLTYPSIEINIINMVLYQDYYYTWMCTYDVFTGALLKTKDFTNYQLVYVPNFKTFGNCEITSCIQGSYMYVAIREDYYRKRMYLLKYSLSENTVVDKCEIKDASSRPFFFKKNNDVYLFHNVTNRADVEILKINQDFLQGYEHFANITTHNFNYFSFAEYNSRIYTAYSNSHRIVISNFSMEYTYDRYSVGNKLIKLFSN